MKKLKSNKIFVVLIAIIVIGILLIFYGLIKYFYLGNGQSKYGSRLNDIENYEVTEKDEKKIEELLSESTSVGDIKLDIKGKIIYLTIDFDENIKLDDAKSLAVKSLEAIDSEVAAYYDIQFILTGKSLEEEGNLFPTMGYKNNNSSQIKWIKS